MSLIFGFDMILHDGVVGNGNLLASNWKNVGFKSREGWTEVMPYDHRGGGIHLSLTNYDKAVSKPIREIRTKFIYSIPIRGDIGSYICAIPERMGETIFDGVSEIAKNAIRTGQALLIFDCILEGHCDVYHKVFENLIKQCNQNDIPIKHAAYFTGNLSSNDKTMKVIKIDWFQGAVRNHVKHSPHQFVNAYDNKQTKYFLNFNREPRCHRCAFVSQIIKRDLKPFFNLSFPSPIMKPYYGLGNIHDQQIITDIEHLKTVTPFIIDTDDFVTNLASIHNPKPYLDSFISVISETRYYEISGEAVFFSEKTYKAIANLHPFIIIGSAHSLRKLKQKGYMTFSTLIDERYDDEYDPQKRLFMIIDEIERLSKLSMDQMREWHKFIFPVLEHNKRVLLSLPSDHEAFQLEKTLKDLLQ